jgi:TonB family protein
MAPAIPRQAESNADRERSSRGVILAPLAIDDGLSLVAPESPTIDAAALAGARRGRPVVADPVGGRLIAGLLAVLIHAVVIVGLVVSVSAPAALSSMVSSVVLLTSASPPLQAPNLAPTVTDDEPVIKLPAPELVIDDDDAATSGALYSAPVLVTSVTEEVQSQLAQRAGLSTGQSATVVLRIQVLAHGRAGDVAVERTGGSEAIDAAAIEYVRQLTWMAGRRGGEPVAMTIRLAVNLALSANRSQSSPEIENTKEGILP